MVIGAAVCQNDSFKLVHFYDEDRTSLALHDIAMTDSCAVALGVLAERGRGRPVVLVSNDSGGRWELLPIKPHGRTISFAANTAWMAAEDGIYRSGDCARTWERVHRAKGIIRVAFADPGQGYAVGHPKTVLETTDGGKSWRKLAAAQTPAAAPARSVYSALAFDGDFGVIVGFHQPKRDEPPGPPAWMDPEVAHQRRQWPNLSLMLQTPDRGRTWRASETSILGQVTRIRIGPKAAALALVEYESNFEFPSELFRIDLARNLSVSVFRDATRAMSDVTVLATGVAYMAGHEPPGSLRQIPIPGRVKILRSLDYSKWEEIAVDYRAVARRVVLAAGAAGPVLAATDTGMILKLARN